MATKLPTKPSTSKAEKSNLKTQKTKIIDVPKKTEKAPAKKPVKKSAEIIEKKIDTVDKVVEKKAISEEIPAARPTASDAPIESETKTLNIIKSGQIIKDSKKYDLERSFTLYPNASFLGGILKNVDPEVSAEIKRTEPSKYLITGGFLPDGVTRHTLDFPCVSIEEGDLLWKELIQYDADIESGKIKHTQPVEKASIKPTEPEHHVATNDHEAIIATMEMEGKKITHSLCGSFQFLHHGANQQSEVQNLLNRQPKNFQYHIKSDGKGKFIEIVNGGLVVRVPKDETQYLPIS